MLCRRRTLEWNGNALSTSTIDSQGLVAYLRLGQDLGAFTVYMAKRTTNSSTVAKDESGVGYTPVGYTPVPSVLDRAVDLWCTVRDELDGSAAGASARSPEEIAEDIAQLIAKSPTDDLQMTIELHPHPPEGGWPLHTEATDPRGKWSTDPRRGDVLLPTDALFADPELTATYVNDLTARRKLREAAKKRRRLQGKRLTKREKQHRHMETVVRHHRAERKREERRLLAAQASTRGAQASESRRRSATSAALAVAQQALLKLQGTVGKNETAASKRRRRLGSAYRYAGDGGIPYSLASQMCKCESGVNETASDNAFNVQVTNIKQKENAFGVLGLDCQRQPPEMLNAVELFPWAVRAAHTSPNSA